MKYKWLSVVVIKELVHSPIPRVLEILGAPQAMFVDYFKLIKSEVEGENG